MADLDDLDDSSLVVHRVDDPVRALPDSEVFGLAGELLATSRTRGTGEGLNSRRDPNAHSTGLDCFELFGR
jgi:hypothetical protein